jgi:guanylate kinase
LIVIVSGPAGVGKTTVVERLLKQPRFVASVSATTRAPRPSDGLNAYTFMNRVAFERMRQDGLLLEWATVHDNYYGTPREPVEQSLAEGKNVLLNIDVQGAAQIREKGLPVISFFLLPPTMEVLRTRLVGRGDGTGDLEKRLKTAERELARQHEYDFRIVNDDLDKTVAEILGHIEHALEREEA